MRVRWGAEHVLWRDGVGLQRAAAAHHAGPRSLLVPFFHAAQLVLARRGAPTFNEMIITWCGAPLPADCIFPSDL